jgi:hypothetical protein
MTIKTVLAVLGVDHWADDLSNAVKFCEGHDAHLTALVMSMGAVPAIATYQAISTAWLDEQQREIEHLGEEAAAVKAELRNADLSSDVQEIYTEFAWVDDDIAERSLYDIAAYLARHGINVEVDRVPSGGRRVDEALRQHALDVAADLIVMGAYNHPRLQQRLFGGVTQSMLKDSTVPMFLSR